MTEDNRVLVRKGARELTRDEVEHVGGSGVNITNVCTFATTTHTGSGDGDGCSDSINDH